MNKVLIILIIFASVIGRGLSNTIMVVLGCSIEYIQLDRVQTALKYQAKYTGNDDFIWFLTGGVKFALTTYNPNQQPQVSESSHMAMHISGLHTQIILDEYSKNTAENFNMLKNHLLTKYNINNFPSIVITTSEFHQVRASKIFDGIFSDMPVKIIPIWNLGKQTCDYCASDEIIHMQHVDADVSNALKINNQQPRLRGGSR